MSLAQSGRFSKLATNLTAAADLDLGHFASRMLVCAEAIRKAEKGGSMDRKSSPAPPGAKHAVLAGFLGWTLDAFDFFVVVFLIDALSHQFGVSKKEIVLTLTATLFMRPVGAVLFGLLADRYGRGTPPLLDVIFFFFIEVAL